MHAAVASLMLSICASACSAQTVHYYTEFSQRGSLGNGAPVYNLGMPIGTVTDVTPGSGGGADVGFDVNRNDSANIRKDTIMVLRDDAAGASLDVMNPDPSSPPASAHSIIDGASNQNDANALVAAKGLAAMAPAVAMSLSASSNAAATMTPLPAWLLFQQQVAALQMQYLLAGTRNAAIAAQQLNQISQSAASLERQLIAAGHSAEAERLRREVENLSRTLTMPPATVSPYPSRAPAPGGSSGSSGGRTLEIPPAH